MRVSHRQTQDSPTQDTDHLSGLLADAAQARRTQLAEIPHDHSLVTAAHRASVTRILDSILAAQARLEAGTYGTCTHCEQDIDDRSLQTRPWTTFCDRCIRH